MDRLRTAAFYAVFLPGTALAIVVGLGVGLLGRGPLMRYVAGWSRFHCLCCRWILGIRQRIEGTLPDGPVLYAAKHEAMYETLELVRILDHPAVVVKREITDFPLWAWVTRLYGLVPVDRDASAQALRTMLRAAQPVRAEGRSLLIFPEGTRVAPGETPPLRPGFAGLYRAMKLPVVPIALDSGSVWPRKGPKRPGTITFRLGEPIPAGLPREEAEERVWAAINGMNGLPQPPRGPDTSELQSYVDAVNAAGGRFDDPAVRARFSPFEVRHRTRVDQSLDPFSDAYFAQQLALYEEVSGRTLDQASGELHPMDVGPSLAGPNPCAGYGLAAVGEQMRVLSTMFSLACLPEDAHVLDLGAGAGLSSEVLAYAGARVHAVDIDPLLARLARERARRMHFAIERSVMNFDDVGMLPDGAYQGAFFFQSLHHCLRPWQLIATLAGKLDADGVIGFAGEPIQSLWWRHWGLRLDEESVYVARQHGWFESGWSHEFIRECFARVGFVLDFYTGGTAGGEIGIATRGDARAAAVRAKAAGAGLRAIHSGPLDVPDSRYATAIGRRGTLYGRPANIQAEPGEGALLFGPYATLEPGRYEIAFLLARDGDGGTLAVDMTANAGKRTLFAERFTTDRAGLVRRTLTVGERLEKVEVRAFVSGPALWSISLPTIARV